MVSRNREVLTLPSSATAIRMCPPGNKRSRGMLTSADLDSPMWLSLPDLEWRIAPWWAGSPAGPPALAANAAHR